MISIKTFTVPKESKGGGTTIINNSGGTGSDFQPHYLWGNYFDDTQDIDGNIICSGNISGVTIQSDSLYSNYVDTDSLTANYIDVSTLDGKELLCDYLTVRKQAHFFELIIDKLKSVGGTVILSAANAKVDKVENVTGGYKLWWRKEDADRAKAISNDFITNDQVICQTFNAQTGVSHNVSNKYYWRLVTATGDSSTMIDGEEKDCNYIVVSDSVKDGASVPEVGDEIMQLGYRGNDDAERQSAIILSAYKSPDTTIEAPAMAQYVGINDFSLSSHKYTWFAANGNNIRGNLKVSSGTSVEDLITSFAVDEDAIVARINSSLGPTGIDIVNQRITLTAANTSINGNLNLYDINNAGLTVYDGDNIPRVNIQSDAVGDVATIANDTYNYYTLSDSGSASSWDLTTSQQSIYLQTYETLHLDNFNVTFYGAGSVYPTAYTTTLTVRIEYPNGFPRTFDVIAYKQDSYGNYKNTQDKVRFSAPSTGTYKVSFRAQNSTTMGTTNTLYLNVNARWQSAESTQTFIGRDGFYSHSGPNKLVWLSEDGLQLRHGFNGIRWNNADRFHNTAMQVLANTKGTSPNFKPVWLSFYNYTPMFSVGTGTTPYLFVSQTVGNINQTKYAFQIDALRDSGICYVNGRAMDSQLNYQDGWVILPPETFTDSEGDTVSLPVGYTVEVINDSGGPLYVVPYSTTEHEVIIVDANNNDNYYCSLNGTQCRDRYIYVGHWAGGRNWIAYHDTQ